MKSYVYKYENLRPSLDFYFFHHLETWLFYLASPYNFVESLSHQERGWYAVMIRISNSRLHVKTQTEIVILCSCQL